MFPKPLFLKSEQLRLKSNQKNGLNTQNLG